MPGKTSKIKTVGTRFRDTSQHEDGVPAVCSCCGNIYKRQKGFFSASQSPLYKGNGGYLTVCNQCLDSMFKQYKEDLGSDQLATERMCLKFDIYWNPEICNMINKHNLSASYIRGYIGKTNLIRYVGKTYDDSIEEQKKALTLQTTQDAIEKETNDISIDSNVIEYWGVGLKPEMYIALEGRRKYWLSKYPNNAVLTPGEEGLLRQICNLEIAINQDRAAGKPIDKSINILNTLFGSMNIRPSQARETEENYIPFGVEIANFEKEQPIIEEDSDFADVDNLRSNLMTWFLGSLCKTAGIKNKYSKMFEDEMKKYTVSRPEYEDEDDDGDASLTQTSSDGDE